MRRRRGTLSQPAEVSPLHEPIPLRLSSDHHTNDAVPAQVACDSMPRPAIATERSSSSSALPPGEERCELLRARHVRTVAAG